MIRIAYSVYLGGTLKRIQSHEKHDGPQEMELLAGVAALHLTSEGLRGTVRLLVRRFRSPHRCCREVVMRTSEPKATLKR
jgi:hypothetical protein